MSFIIWLILAILFGLWGFSSISQSSSSVPAATGQSCVQTDSTSVRCGPMTSGGIYSLPSEGVVIRAVVNNGPIEPQYQAGYELEIGADGSVSITEQEGESQFSGRSMLIGIDKVQALLGSLESCGLYGLPQSTEFTDADRPVGGGVSVIQVHLADGDWEVSGDLLAGSDSATFAGCQQQLAEKFDLSMPR